MQSDQTFIQKTFQLINQLTGHSTFITIKRDQYIKGHLRYTSHRQLTFFIIEGFSLQKCMIFYLDYMKRLFVHVGTFPFHKGFQLLLKFELFLQTTIKLRFRKLSNPHSPKNQKSSQQQSSQTSKPTRKQKTIQQVQQLVTLWRKYFEMTDQNGKKLYTLQNAAMRLGMQKKTLDDYYYKLKTAQSLGFDFEKNKHQKIGMLRKFVKENKNKKSPIVAGSSNNGLATSMILNNQHSWDNGFFSSKGGQLIGNSSVGIASGFSNAHNNSNSYNASYHHAPLAQKPPQDEIDKYFAKDSDQSLSSSQQSQQSQ